MKLSKITEPGVRRRAELYYQQLDALRFLRQQARKELLAEARKHSCNEVATPDSWGLVRFGRLTWGR